MKKNLVYVIGASALLLAACGDSTGSSSESAPTAFVNEENYNAVLTPQEIKTDLKEIGGSASLNTDLLSNVPIGFRKTANKLSEISEEEICIPYGSTEEDGTKGSGYYSYEELKITNGSGDDVTSCNTPNSNNFSFNIAQNLYEEYDNTIMELSMVGKMSMQQNPLKMSYSSKFEGTYTEGDFKLNQWGKLTMLATEEGMTMDMSMNLHFMEDKYRCSFDIKLAFNDLEEDEESTVEIGDSCDIIHGGETVGKIEFGDEGTVVYDQEGNVIE